MTAPHTPPGTKPSGSRRGWRLAGIGVLIMAAALAVGVAIGTANSNNDPGAAAPPTITSTAPGTTSAAPTSTSAASTANQANGCLGGADPFAAILPAQQAASLDDAGAAAFARTYFRWISTYPIDPRASEVLKQVTSTDGAYGKRALTDLNQSARGMQIQGYTEARTLADSGSYRFSSKENTESARIDVVTDRQLTRNDGRVETQKNIATFVLEAESGRWRIVGILPQTQTDPYANDPNKPWQSYAGAC